MDIDIIAFYSIVVFFRTIFLIYNKYKKKNLVHINSIKSIYKIKIIS